MILKGPFGCFQMRTADFKMMQLFRGITERSQMRVQGTFSDDSLQGTGLEAKLQWQRLKPASGT